nr:MAG TPA: hypothetical protein [Caudoviricetes sp.]
MYKVNENFFLIFFYTYMCKKKGEKWIQKKFLYKLIS